jgi:hypothetical protein
MSESKAVREIAVTATQRGEGLPETGKTLKLGSRDGSLDPKMHLPCANPACKKGGFALRAAVDKLVKSGEAHASVLLPCAGYTGALRTEKGPAAHCGNTLEATIDVKYAAAKA